MNSSIQHPFTFFLVVLVFFFPLKKFSQNPDSVSKHNIAVLTGCSILEGNGIRAELPDFFYSSGTYGFSFTPTIKFTREKNPGIGLNAAYYYFIKPSFRDITFFLHYNVSYFFGKDQALTHILGVGTQIDLSEHFFLQHSIGLGLQQSAVDFNFLNYAGQLKLSIGYFIKKIPVERTKDDWEH